MKKRPSKAELRKQLANEVQSYLKHGGEVKELPQGASGLVDGRYNAIGFDRPKEPRTDVRQLLNTIDQRKEQRKKPAATTASQSKPKKKIIYDDFGDPVRIVWE